MRIGVIEADIDTMVDAEKVAAQGAAAVQLRTGGFCHLDASMVDKGLNNLDSAKLDLVIVENAGNLVCPAAFIIKSDKTVKSRLVWGRDPFLR